MTGRFGALLDENKQAIEELNQRHACSNCGRPTGNVNEADIRTGPAVYTCETCGQREEVRWRAVPVYVVEEVRVIEEPNIILGEA